MADADKTIKYTTRAPIEPSTHWRHHPRFWLGVNGEKIGYHPELPLAPLEGQDSGSAKSNVGVPSEFLLWQGGIAPTQESSHLYPQLFDLKNIDTLVVRASSNILVHKEDKPGKLGRAEYNVKCIAEDVAETGLPTIIVTGGAKGLSEKCGVDLAEGQGIVSHLWENAFSGLNQPVNVYESLVNPQNIYEKSETFSRGVESFDAKHKIPIVNEQGLGNFEGANDEVTSRIVKELQKSGRNVLVTMLMSEEGIYTFRSIKQKLYEDVIRLVLNPTGLIDMVYEENSRYGTGGLETKLSYVTEMVNGGAHVVLLNGQYCNADRAYQRGKRPQREYKPIVAALKGFVVGTRIQSYKFRNN